MTPRRKRAFKLKMKKGSLPKGFHIDFLFPEEYEDFIAEIYFDGNFLCVIDQDSGFDAMEIEFPFEKVNLFQFSRARGKFKLREFEDALEKAKKRLWELRKNEDESSE